MSKKVTKLRVASESEANAIFQAMGVTTYDEAIAQLMRAKERDEQPIVVQERIVGAALDAMLALYKAIEREYGITVVEGFLQSGLFGPPERTKVREIVIEVEPGKRIAIPIGEFKLPGGRGVVKTGPGQDEEERECLNVMIETLRKHRETCVRLVAKAREILQRESIYRGRAVRLKFQEAWGSEIAVLSFMDLTGVNPDDLVFSRDLDGAIRANLFALIKWPVQARSMGVPMKRAILLAGPYGCGKTMLAHVAAKLAAAHGRTFLYLEDVLQLPKAIRMGGQYGPSLVFAEDFDRIADNDDDGNLETVIRNTLDGIDTKDLDTLVVLTTNHPEKIPEALTRPGRIDVPLEIGPPNAEAVERMLRNYARGRIPEDENLGTVAVQLAGQIPAVIREVIERAKLSALDRMNGVVTDSLVASDIETAAYTVLQGRKLLARPLNVPLTEHERACQLLGEALGKAVSDGTKLLTSKAGS